MMSAPSSLSLAGGPRYARRADCPHDPPAPPSDPPAPPSDPTDPTDPPTDPPTQPDPPPVNEKRLVDLFMRLCQVRGETYNERDIADTIKQEVADIGFEGATVKEDGAGEQIGGNAGNVIVTIPGNVADAPPILFSSHMDTVRLAVGSKPILGEDGVIRTDGSTALGGDNRAGCAEILEAMREIKESNLPHGPIQLFFCVGEEGGLLGSSVLNPEDINAKYSFVMDVFKANQIYMQGDGLLFAPKEKPSAGDVDHAHRHAASLASTPPDELDLTDKEKEIHDFTTTAMENIGLVPEYYRLEWAGTDAMSLRDYGFNAISLGAGENNPHTRRESVAVNDLVASTKLVRSIVDLAAKSVVPTPVPPTVAAALQAVG